MPPAAIDLPFSLENRQTRRHSNGRTALVASYRDSARWLSAVMDPAGFVRVGAARDQPDEARILADALAHPNCDGIGCSPWLEAPPFTEIAIVPVKRDH